VDLVDEEGRVVLEVRQDGGPGRRGSIDDGARGRRDSDAELARDDCGQRRLAQAGGPETEDVVEVLVRPRAASMKSESRSLIRAWPTYSPSVFGRRVAYDLPLPPEGVAANVWVRRSTSSFPAPV
jgi:hypothetical protein